MLSRSIPVLGLALLAAPMHANARAITQKDLATLDRVAEPRISPDGKWVAYDVTITDYDANKRKHEIWRVAADGSGAVKVADGSGPRWSPDGKHIYFTKPVNDVGQVWSVDCGTNACTNAHAVTSLPIEVGSFRVTPNGKALIVSLAVFPDKDDPADTKARLAAQAASKASGKLFDKVFIRHWDTWADGTRNHLFSIRLGTDGRTTGPLYPLMKGFDGNSPTKPFGDDGDYSITPDSNHIVFSARVAGKSEPWSTNFDNWSVPYDGSAAPSNMTASNAAWDAAPVFYDQGNCANAGLVCVMAYRAMKRTGFEADRYGIMVQTSNGPVKEIDPNWDRSPDKLVFSGDGRSLYVTAEDVGQSKIFKVDIATGNATALTGNGHVADFDVAHAGAGDVIVYARDGLDSPAQLYVLRPGQQAKQITHIDANKLAGVDFAKFEPFTFTGWNNETVHGYVVKPQQFDATKKYPVVYMIHGGPQGSFGEAWSYRWNPQVWAGWGYAVVMVDFHGSTGYGQAFTDAISGHWGDRPLEDLQKGWTAALAKYSWLDGSRACAAGASYGGYMVYWIAGMWNQPFKCLIDHDGVFDNRFMGYATEELWFSEWENGHTTVWQNPGNYELFNPLNHVKDWTKPMLIIHSSNDFRIPIDQGIAAFTALQRKGIESEFLTFPNENHWVLKAQDSVQWHDTVQAWLKRWIGP